MQIAILVEQMRREGYEVLVSRPEVLWKKDAAGNPLEPIEKLFIEIPNDCLGSVMENLSSRKAQITNMNHVGNQVSVEALVPMRGLIGFETDLVNKTKGMGVMSHLFHELRRNRGAQERLARLDGFRRCDKLRAQHGAGARTPDGGAGRQHLRRHDCGRKRPRK
jgi:predicted membrane GTPase involved in stress response